MRLGGRRNYHVGILCVSGKPASWNIMCRRAKEENGREAPPPQPLPAYCFINRNARGVAWHHRSTRQAAVFMVEAHSAFIASMLLRFSPRIDSKIFRARPTRNVLLVTLSSGLILHIICILPYNLILSLLLL